MIKDSFARIESYIQGCISFFDDTEMQLYDTRYVLIRQTNVGIYYTKLVQNYNTVYFLVPRLV